MFFSGIFPGNLEQLTVYNKPNGPSVYLSKWFSDLLVQALCYMLEGPGFDSR
jgi:hypothetical protein